MIGMGTDCMMPDNPKDKKELEEFWKKHLDEDAVKFDAAMRIIKAVKSNYPFHLPSLIEGVVVWSHCSIHPMVQIGKGTVIGFGVNITGPVKIGKKVRIQSYVFIPEGITIEDRVFIGPRVTFTNVKYPKVRDREPKIYSKTLIKEGASIGAGSIIGTDITIGKGSLVGMGSVVLKDVKPGWIVRGNPAHHIRKVTSG